MALNAIGNLTFFSLSGPPVFSQTQTLARTRAGCDGTTIKQLGVWGSTWDCRSVATAASWAYALALVHSYHAEARATTNVVYAGVALATLGHRYFVRTVRILALEPHVSASDGSLARVEAVWQLEPIAI